MGLVESVKILIFCGFWIGLFVLLASSVDARKVCFWNVEGNRHSWRFLCRDVDNRIVTSTTTSTTSKVFKSLKTTTTTLGNLRCAKRCILRFRSICILWKKCRPNIELIRATTSSSVSTTTMTSTTMKRGFWDDYKREMDSNGIDGKYLSENRYYDFGNPIVDREVQNIRSLSVSINDAIKRSNSYVRKMGYCSGSGCFKIDSPSSEIMADGYGICSTKSRVLISLLRGLGIASRGASGKNCLGFDHAWVEVWTQEKGWRSLESTISIPCFYKWGNCGDGYYDGVPDDDMANDNCWSKTLEKFIPCDTWARECFWVPSDWNYKEVEVKWS